MTALRPGCCLLLAALLSGCTAARRRTPEATIVRRVQFEGNGGLLSGQSDYQLRSQLEQKSSSRGILTFPLNYMMSPAFLDRDGLIQEAYRLEIWYAHNGWFDARFGGWVAHQVRKPRDRRSQVIDLRGHVRPGPLSLVRSFEIEGLDAPGLSVIAGTLKRTGDLVEGDPFNLAITYATRDEILRRLREAAHPYATVTPKIAAFPRKRAVDIVFESDPGISARFGEVRISGNEHVRSSVLRNALPFSPGDPYKASLLDSAQGRLFDLGTFSVVSVRPELSDPSERQVPVEITVSETTFRTFRLGAGLELETTTVTPRLSTSFKHVNLLHELLRFESSASGGFAWDAAGPLDVNSVLPTYDLSGSLGYPRLARQRVVLELAAGLEQDLQAAQFLFRSPSADLRVIWKAIRRRDVRRKGGRQSRELTWTMGPHWEKFRYLPIEGLDLASFLASPANLEYTLTAYDLGATFDTRDDPLDVHRGYRLHAAMRQALPLTPADYRFTQLDLDGRWFWSLSKGGPSVLGLRGHGRVMQAWDDRELLELPPQERAFLGGSESLRGYRIDQIGPYDAVCTNGTDPRYLPRGGRVAVGGSAELRQDWNYGVTFVGFADAGALSDDVPTLLNSLPSLFSFGAGVGARYQSPVGPLRLDIAARPMRPTTPQTVFGCNVGVNLHRTEDLLSTFSNSRFPVGINIYLGIGQAF